MSRRGALLFAAMCVLWGVPYLMIRGLDTRGAEVGRAVYEAFGALPGATMQYDLTDKFSVVNKTLLESPNEIPQLPTA